VNTHSAREHGVRILGRELTVEPPRELLLAARRGGQGLEPAGFRRSRPLTASSTARPSRVFTARYRCSRAKWPFTVPRNQCSRNSEIRTQDPRRGHDARVAERGAESSPPLRRSRIRRSHQSRRDLLATLLSKPSKIAKRGAGVLQGLLGHAQSHLGHRQPLHQISHTARPRQGDATAPRAAPGGGPCRGEIGAAARAVPGDYRRARCGLLRRHWQRRGRTKGSGPESRSNGAVARSNGSFHASSTRGRLQNSARRRRDQRFPVAPGQAEKASASRSLPSHWRLPASFNAASLPAKATNDLARQFTSRVRVRFVILLNLETDAAHKAIA
jgi:hypothetical protein